MTTASLPPAFPHGLFVAQDDANDRPAAPQNFKYVPLEKILRLDPRVNARARSATPEIPEGA